MPLIRPEHYYLPVNDDAMRWGLYITGIGRATVPAGGPAYPQPGHPCLYDFRWEQGRVLPEFQMVFITGGCGVFESRTSDQVAIPDRSVFFLYPGTWHRYRPLRERGWTERWVGFNGELAHRLMDMSILRSDVPVRRIARPAPLIASFDELMDMIVAEPAGNSVLLSLYALGLLGKTIRVAVGVTLPSALDPCLERRSTTDAIVSEALTLIWTRGHQAITVEYVAEAVGVTRRTLERRFQQSVGHSVVKEIIACRMSRARRLLEETTMPVKAIAYLAGFSSKERMRVTFTQQEGHSPLQYRYLAQQARMELKRKPDYSVPARKNATHGEDASELEK